MQKTWYLDKPIDELAKEKTGTDFEELSEYSQNNLHMKTSAFVCLLLLTNLFCRQQADMDCKQFKSGLLRFHAELNNMTYSIKRNSSRQFETELETGKQSEWKITWLNECEYKLILLKDNAGLLNSQQGKPAPEFTYRIIGTTSDYYIFETRFAPSMPIYRDTIFKVN